MTQSKRIAPHCRSRAGITTGACKKVAVGNCVIVVAIVAGSFASTSAADDSDSLTRAASLVENYCLICHGGDDTNAGIDLTEFDSELDVWGAPSQWSKMLYAVEDKRMPPEDGDELADSDRAFLTGWIRETIDHVDVNRIPRDPGFIAPRRLNQFEYNYTVQDLFGVDINPADAFPKDQIYGEGFDNEAISLTVGSLWFEKALAASEEIVRAVWKDSDALSRLLFVRPIPPPPEEKAVYVTSAEQAEQCDMSDGDFTVLARFRGTTTGTILLKAPPQAGFMRQSKELRYTNNSLVYSIRRGRELVAQDVDINDDKIHTVGLHVASHRASLYLDGRLLVSRADFSRPDGQDHVLTVGKPKQSKDDQDFEKFVAGFEHLSFFEKAIPAEDMLALTGTDATSRVRGTAFHWDPSVKRDAPIVVTNLEAATSVLTSFLGRAFRRPATEEELDRYLGLFESASNEGLPFDIAMQLPVKAALASPKFLFRAEAVGESSEPYAVSSVEMASRLSYFLWASLPDAELWEAGVSGALSHSDGLLAQVDRMLADDKADRFFERFTLQWLRTEGLGESIRPDADRFPNITSTLMSAMKQESVRVFEDVVKNNHSLTALLDRDTTFVNGELAAHYGLGGHSGEPWQEVSVDESDRGGLLTHAAVLTVSSSPRRTSPVFRGKWLLDVVIGEPPPPPPPDVPALGDTAADPGATLREILAIHRREAACAGCHNRIDPLGLAMEQYDAVGRLRAEPQDTTATLPNGVVLSGVGDLNRMLLGPKRSSFLRHVTRKILSYALGRDLGLADERPLQSMLAKLENDDFRAGDLIREVVLSDPFRNRMNRTEPGTSELAHDQRSEE